MVVASVVGGGGSGAAGVSDARPLPSPSTIDPEARRLAERERERKLHSDQEMFSCTTLSNRMGKDYYIKSDGCMDFGFNR